MVAFEIAVEIDELTLRQYGLTLAQVANKPVGRLIFQGDRSDPRR